MKIKGNEVDIGEVIDFASQQDLLLKRRKNNLLLSDFQVNVLKQNGFDYLKYSNIHELLFDIEEDLNEDYDEELDLVSSQIAEFIYYSETKK